MAAVLGRLSAIGLGVLELVLAAVTLLRIVVIVGVALVARILAFPSACVATCLCCGQQLQRQGAEQGAAGRRGRATVTTARDGEPEFHQEGSAHGMTHLSSQADSCKREIDAQVSQSGATLARCQTWSHNQFLFDQKGDCSEWSDALRGPACAPCRECRPRAVPARGSSSGGQDCPARATCGAHEDGHTSPAVVLSSMHSRSTPATLSLQLCLAVDLARGTCLSNPCTHAATPAGDAAPGSTDGAAQGAPHSWAAVEELQQELEEERSAAEEAAAEALRMITRLQVRHTNSYPQMYKDQRTSKIQTKVHPRELMMMPHLYYSNYEA